MQYMSLLVTLITTIDNKKKNQEYLYGFIQIYL